MISIRQNERKAIFSASAAIGAAPRIEATVHRLITCDQCGMPLEVELDTDFARAAGKSLFLALRIYNPENDYRAVVRSGMTILSTNRHLGWKAPASRQCAGGIYAGSNPMVVYAEAWAWAVEAVTTAGGWTAEREEILKEIAKNGRDAPSDLSLPVGVERLFTPRELQRGCPIEPMDLLRVLDLPGVRRQFGSSAEDGVVYMLDSYALMKQIGGPLAPEKLVALCGGEGGLRGPCLEMPRGLVIRSTTHNAHGR